MENTDKKSRKNSSSDDTLLYVLLFLLVALLAGGLIYWKWPKNTEPVYNYEEELGKWDNSPTEKVVSKLISDNRNRIKTAERVLGDKMRTRKLTAEEKKEVRAELDSINTGIYRDLWGIDLKEREKDSPDLLTNLYKELYEQGKALIRIKSKISANRTYEEAKKQLEFQKKWKKVFASEWQDMKPKISEWLIKWHHQARELIPKHGGRILTHCFIPLKINGREANPNSEKDINYFLDMNNNSGREDWEESVTLLSQPLTIDFKGYGGFVDKKKLKDSSEGSETFGLTSCNPMTIQPRGWGFRGRPAETLLKYYDLDKRCRQIVITLSKKLFLNRLGYEEWITDAKEENNSRNYYDICFESAAETIIHELAHSIVDVMRFEYDGEEGGGHGKLFYELMEDIEKIVKKSPEFEEFKTWWQKPEKENKEWSAASVLGDSKKSSHWDEWKYWYIGGGVGVLMIGLVVVIVFWDELTGSKKNVKN
jgi:hypothetical protein